MLGANMDSEPGIDEKSLIKNEEQYRQFFEMNISAAYITKPDGRVVACNKAFAEMFGFKSVDEVLATNIHKIYFEPGSRDAFLQLLCKEKKLVHHETKFRRVDGATVETLENTFGIFNDIGDLVEIWGFMIDITERKKLERQLQQAQRMEAIGTLAGGIAHDFNNILMGIQGYISLMRLDLESDPSSIFHSYMAKMEQQIESASDLSRQLLGYARKGTYEVRSVDLNQIVAETAEVFGRLKKNITVRFQLYPGLLAINADKTQIEQVLLNLFTNAADSMPESGMLTVSTENIDRDQIKNIPVKSDAAQFVKLTVSDTGAGMDQETLKRIFDPYFTTKSIRRATGMGLASAYGIITSHGGHISVESEKGRGTSFYVFLPRSDQTKCKYQKKHENRSPQSKTILIVDDEKMVLDIGAMLLEKLQYKVFKADNGREAIKIFSENKDQIGLVLLDMIMPEMPGSAVFEELKKIDSEVKVLISSGYSMDNRAKELLGRGCCGFIQKPYRLETLTKKITEIL
jgi:two-component system, cell cycle sensor histidine kinase and response regulator CckA